VIWTRKRMVRVHFKPGVSDASVRGDPRRRSAAATTDRERRHLEDAERVVQPRRRGAGSRARTSCTCRSRSRAVILATKGGDADAARRVGRRDPRRRGDAARPGRPRRRSPAAPSVACRPPISRSGSRRRRSRSGSGSTSGAATTRPPADRGDVAGAVLRRPAERARPVVLVLEQTEASLTSRNNGYWLKLHDAARRVGAVYVIHPDCVRRAGTRDVAAGRVPDPRRRLRLVGLADERRHPPLPRRLPGAGRARRAVAGRAVPQRARAAALAKERYEGVLYDEGVLNSLAVTFPARRRRSRRALPRADEERARRRREPRQGARVRRRRDRADRSG
jgi:hypothetical protein